MNATKRYRCDLAYDGSCFHGWARQSGYRTVCQEVEDRLSLILDQKVSLTVAGRTDTGVHALGQVAHCDLHEVSALRNLERLLLRCAKFFPPDIRLLNFTQVPNSFDARFSALSRHYEYKITTSSIGPMPSERQYIIHIPRKLNLDLLNSASQIVIGFHDFSGFCRRRDRHNEDRPYGDRPSDRETNLRHLYRCEWTVDHTNNIYTAHIAADAFCWSMVRALVGGIVQVGLGKRDYSWLGEVLARTTRQSDVPIFPAKGLTLVKVEYPSEEFYAQRANRTRSVRQINITPITDNWFF